MQYSSLNKYLYLNPQNKVLLAFLDEILGWMLFLIVISHYLSGFHSAGGSVSPPPSLSSFNANCHIVLLSQFQWQVGFEHPITEAGITQQKLFFIAVHHPYLPEVDSEQSL